MFSLVPFDSLRFGHTATFTFYTVIHSYTSTICKVARFTSSQRRMNGDIITIFDVARD